MSSVAGACFNMRGAQLVLNRSMAAGDPQIVEVFAGILPMLSKEGRRSPEPEDHDKAPSQKKQKKTEGDRMTLVDRKRKRERMGWMLSSKWRSTSSTDPKARGGLVGRKTA